MITVLDYGAGNLTSVGYAVSHLGEIPDITRDPEKVRRADRVIFPGVGAARASMENLIQLGLDEALLDAHARGTPILGICIGCQVVFTESEEDSGVRCLNLIEGDVKRFRFPDGVRRKVPHIGWNEVRLTGAGRQHPVFAGVPEGSQFYFVHSYYPSPKNPEHVMGVATYGEIDFTAAVSQGNLVAAQFHVEKSGPAGLGLLKSFLDWTP